MTPKDRLLGVLDGRAVDGPAVVVPYQGILLRDHWSDITAEPWWTLHGLDLDALVRVLADLDRAVGCDWLPSWSVAPRDVRQRRAIQTEGHETYVVDSQTGRRERIQPSSGGTGVWQGRHESAGDAADHVRPVRAEDMLADGSMDLTRLIVERFGQRRAIHGGVGTPMWATHSLLGFQGAMTALYDDPDGMHRLLSRLLDNGVACLRAHAEVGCTCIWIEDCMTSRDLISLDQFREFALPGLGTLIDEARRLGMRPIHYFCGDLSDRLADLVSLRPAAIAWEESKKGMDLDLSRLAGHVPPDVALVGNLDAIDLLRRGTDDQVRDEIARLLDIGAHHGRFVMSLGSPVTPETPVSRVRRFVELTRSAR